MAERVGFEPTVPLPVHLISSQGRYNHFDTAPYFFDMVEKNYSVLIGCDCRLRYIIAVF